MWPSLVLALLVALPARAAGTLETDLRYVASQALPNTLEGTADARRAVASWLDLEVAGRFAASARIAERLEYKGEAVVPLLGFFAARARVAQSYRFNETVSSTTLLFTGELRGSPFPFLELFAQAGWYERFVMLSQAR